MPKTVTDDHARTSECLFVTACSMDEYAEEKRTEKNLIVRSGISEAETTNNKRLRSTFCIEAIQTRKASRGLFATAELLVTCYYVTCCLKRSRLVIMNSIVVWIRGGSISPYRQQSSQ